MNIKLLVIASLVLLIGSLELSAATTGTLGLKGAISAITEVSVTGSGNYQTLVLTTTPSTPLEVGTVNYRCNDKDGFTLTLSSANGTASGLLKGAISGNTDTVAYTVLFDGTAQTIASGSVILVNAAAKTIGTLSKTLAITFTGNTDLTADDYTDTLTLTIAAK